MRRIVSSLLIWCCCLVLPVAAAEPPDQPADEEAATHQPRQLSAPVQRAVDPSAAVLSHDSDGRQSLNLNGSHQHVYMARVGADGALETFCASHEQAVRSFLFRTPAGRQ